MREVIGLRKMMRQCPICRGLGYRVEVEVSTRVPPLTENIECRACDGLGVIITFEED